MHFLRVRKELTSVSQTKRVFMGPRMKSVRICDRVYGEVHLSPFVAHLAGSRTFHRLDGVRQLGGCAFLYPSATHTRREHSLGVCHLAGEMGRHLMSKYPNLVNHDDILCLEIAGLVHDLGHGPFSHTFEDYMHQSHPRWSHEDMSRTLFNSMFYDAVESFNPFEKGHPDQHFAFICLLIDGIDETTEWPGFQRVFRDEEKRFLLEIVHNRISGIDVDKLDYLCRDSLSAFGATRAINLQRLIRATHVVFTHGSHPVPMTTLAFDESVSFEVAELYALRTRLHRQLYQHHKVILVESLIVDLMKAIDKVATEGNTFRDIALDAKRFVNLTDASVLSNALLSHPSVAPKYEALFGWPNIIQTRSTVVLRTHPACAKCGHETELGAAFCEMCGTSTVKRVGTALSDGTLVTPESLIDSIKVTSEIQSKVGSAFDVRVHILDVQCGKGVCVQDPHGRTWRDYDPLRRLLFVGKDGQLARVSSAAQQTPKIRHMRTARCYIVNAEYTVEDARYVDRVFANWGRSVGSIVEEYEV